MDRRQEKTRAAVFEAFNTLLGKKKYGGITVQEIIDEANIGRSTFYSHFQTKDELLRAMCTEIFHHVFEEHLKKEGTHDFSGEHQSFQDRLTHILYHLQDNQKNIRRLLSSESGQLFMQYFKEYLMEVFEGFWGSLNVDVPKDYALSYLVSTFAETVSWWLTRENKYSPEEIAGFYLKMLSFKMF